MRYAKEIATFLEENLLLTDKAERKAITFWLMEYYLGLRRADILSNKELGETHIDWKSILHRLNAQEPIQYIIGKAPFYDREFRVTSDVLIPRPETEELIQLILLYAAPIPSPKILDIGTGSGCIAITLAAELPHASVTAVDVSEKALQIAKENANLNDVAVRFIQDDILQPAQPFLTYDIIVSNPPYVTQKEAAHMQANVLDYEPHLALFVANDQPLLFYEAIAQFAQKHLTEGGLLFLEINENYGPETRQCIEKYGFTDTQLIKDINKKDRIVTGKHT